MEMTVPPGGLLMTSREIADLTGKAHFNVAIDIRKMLSELGEDVLTFQGIYLDCMNRKQTEYLLDRELTDTLLTGYSAVLRRKVIARWRELEQSVAAPVLPDFTNPAAAARAWADQVDARQALTAKIAIDAPKVLFAETIRAIDGLCHIDRVGKMIGIGRTKLFARLREDKILINGSRMPFQKYIDKGYFSVVEGNPYTDSKGISRPTFTTMVTGAGQIFLVRRYAKTGDAES
ncbi:phage regulatory protein/antirepressor Ant [Duganella sp. BJB476]|uniref:phage antirepressor KilAC domain-containing protein n=1 Tax=Duganella sp. BJB476 TaxID=1871176 RepID=UPI0011C10B63|nr:phage regulatory protein/antirepressor Ant [Duganella sp. BJB476]